MNKNLFSIIVSSLIISFVGVFIIDYFFHLYFSTPMETTEYFYAKMTMYFVSSVILLSFVNFSKKEFTKVFVSGLVVATLWGAYYNVLPIVFDYYPFGISLEGLSFLGMGILGTGLAFGAVHTLAFVVGYYSAKKLTGPRR